MWSLDLQRIKNSWKLTVCLICGLYLNINWITQAGSFNNIINYDFSKIILILVSYALVHEIYFKIPWKIGLILLYLISYSFQFLAIDLFEAIIVLWLTQTYILFQVLIQEESKINPSIVFIVLSLLLILDIAPIIFFFIFLVILFIYSANTKFIHSNFYTNDFNISVYFLLLSIIFVIVSFYQGASIYSINDLKNYGLVLGSSSMLYFFGRKKWVLILKATKLQVWSSMIALLPLYLLIVLGEYIPAKYNYLYVLFLLIFSCIFIIQGVISFRFIQELKHRKRHLNTGFNIGIVLCFFEDIFLIIPFIFLCLMIFQANVPKHQENIRLNLKKKMNLALFNVLINLNKKEVFGLYDWKEFWSIESSQKEILKEINNNLNIFLWQEIRPLEPGVYESNIEAFRSCSKKMSLIEINNNHCWFYNRLNKSTNRLEYQLLANNTRQLKERQLFYTSVSKLFSNIGLRLFFQYLKENRKIILDSRTMEELNHRLVLLNQIDLDSKKILVQKEMLAIKSILFLYFNQKWSQKPSSLQAINRINNFELNAMFMSVKIPDEEKEKFNSFFLHLKPIELVQKKKYEYPFVEEITNMENYLKVFKSHLFLDESEGVDKITSLLFNHWFYPILKNSMVTYNVENETMEFMAYNMPGFWLLEGQISLIINDNSVSLTKGNIINPNDYLSSSQLKLELHGWCSFALIKRHDFDTYFYLFENQ